MRKKWIKVVVVIICVVSVLYVGSHLFLYGWTFPGCGERETSLAIPQELANSSIVFQKQIMYVQRPASGPQNPGDQNCTAIAKKAKGDAMTFDKNYFKAFEFGDLGYKAEMVPLETEFKVVAHSDVKCYGSGFSCFDSGPPGEEFLLQDPNGNLWVMSQRYFKDYKLVNGSK